MTLQPQRIVNQCIPINHLLLSVLQRGRCQHLQTPSTHPTCRGVTTVSGEVSTMPPFVVVSRSTNKCVRPATVWSTWLTATWSGFLTPTKRPVLSLKVLINTYIFTETGLGLSFVPNFDTISMSVTGSLFSKNWLLNWYTLARFLLFFECLRNLISAKLNCTFELTHEALIEKKTLKGPNLHIPVKVSTHKRKKLLTLLDIFF